MANNVELNSGSGGATLATDDIGGTHYQVVKLATGAEDAATYVSDSNPLPVDDAGGSLTVDNAHLTSLGGAVSGTEVQVDVVAALPAGDNNIGNVDIVSLPNEGQQTMANSVSVAVASDQGALDVSGATVPVDLGANNDVTIDGSSVVRAEDAVHSTGDTGVMGLAVRNDTLAALAGTDGDYSPLQVNASGALYIQEGSAIDVSAATVTVSDDGSFAVTATLSATDNAVLDNIDTNTTDLPNVIGTDGAAGPSSAVSVAGTESGGNLQEIRVDSDGHLQVDIQSGGGTGGTSETDDGAFTAGTGSGTPAMGFASSDSVNSGDVGVLAMTTGRHLKVQPNDFQTPAGQSMVDDTNDALQVNVVAGSTSGTEYTEDAAAPANPAAPALSLVRDDALSGQTTADGDIVAARGTDRGEIYVKHADAIPVTDNSGSLTVDNATLSTTGGGTEAGALRVTVASDSTGVLSVDDNGGSLTVDTAGGALDVSAATVTVDLGANNDVTIDGSSVVRAEDAVHSTGDTGIMGLAVRNDTLAALAGTDGDYTPLQVNASGALYVQEGSALDVSGATVTVTDAGNFTLAANSGTDIGDVDVTSVAGANFAAAEAAALPAEFVVVAGDDGTDTHPIQVDASGNLKAILQANDGVDIGDVDVTSIAAGSNLIGDVGLSGARTSGGTSLFYSNDLDESEEQVKGSGGQIYWLHAMNLTGNVIYLQVFNAAAANVTVGTTTPDLEFPLPTQGDTNGAGFTLAIPNGIAMGTGITVAATGDSQGSGTVGVNACFVNIGYA